MARVGGRKEGVSIGEAAKIKSAMASKRGEI